MTLAEQLDDAKSGKQKQGQGAVFEFTRRKRWSDILISEAPDVAFFILSTTGTIWYTGPAVVDLLGWKVGELVDKDVSHILNDDDLVDFREDLERCASSNARLSSYARLKCRPPPDDASNAAQKEVLYELRGNFVSDLRTDEKMFFILSAKQYPSKNMAIINTMLELKIEHEMLSQRLAELRIIKEQRNLSSSVASIPPKTHGSSVTQLPKPQHSPSGFRHYNMGDDALPTGSDSSQGNKDEEDASGKKKRPFSPDHQFVCYTCGRTDSPEWRKGPTGPKTLCNACGLRWAKRTKKIDKGRKSNNSSKEESPSASQSHKISSNKKKSLSTANPPAPHPALQCTPPSANGTMPSSSSGAGVAIAQGSMHTPSPLSASSIPTFLESPLAVSPLAPVSPRDFLLPPPVPHTQIGQAPYSTLQHALVSEPEPSSRPQAHFPPPHLPPWATSRRNGYGY